MNTKCCVTKRVTGSGVMCDLCVIVTHHDRLQEIAWLSQLDLVIDESCWLHHVSCLRSVTGKTLFYLWSGPGGASSASCHECHQWRTNYAASHWPGWPHSAWAAKTRQSHLM